ncbi:MAG: DciA family protein [Elusimicrobiota bacterium]
MNRKRGGMKSLADIVSSRGSFFGINFSNLPILSAAWEREYGGLSKHFTLEGIEKNSIIVKASGSCAANEIKIRKNEIIRTLNKYFKNKWIKDVKVVCKI